MRTFPTGERVEVDGRGLWVLRAGTGGPAVVTVPGGGAFGLDHLLVHERVAALTTSVLYDRAGTGWSDDADLPRSADAVVDELRALLRALGVPAPYVLVGHSLGGVYVRRFAQRFPGDVAGLVLLDPAHEDYDTYQPEHLRLATHAGAPVPEVTDEIRALGRAQLGTVLGPLPDAVRGPLIEQHVDRLAVGFTEAGRILDDLEDLRSGGPLPAVPLVVLSGQGAEGMLAPEAVVREQSLGNERLCAAVAAAGGGEHRPLPDASHTTIPTARPDAVADAVRAVIGPRGA